MAKVGEVEGKIREVDELELRFKHKNGRDVRGDRGGVEEYKYKNRAANSLTVAEYKKNRLSSNYPDFEIEILDGNGEPVHGNRLLRNVRSTY